MSDAPDQSARDGTETSPVDFVALSAGRTIGRYEIVSVLGQGGFDEDDANWLEQRV